MTTEQLFGEGMWVLSTKITSPFCSVVCQLSLYHRPPPPLFALHELCDMELTCRFGGNMMLLSCDVKVATRPLKYIHARVGITASPLGSAQLWACERKWGASRSLHQQGQAGQPTWRRSRDRLGFEAAEMEVKIYEGWQWLTTLVGTYREHGLSDAQLDWHNPQCWQAELWKLPTTIKM